MASKLWRGIVPGMVITGLLLLGACDALPGRQAASTSAGQNALAGSNATPTLPALENLPAPASSGLAFQADQPLSGENGQALSSGLARLSEGRAELVSRQGDAASLEWIAYGLGGLDASQQPVNLQITLEQVTGAVQVGLSDFSGTLWQWKYIAAPGVHDLPLEGLTFINPAGNCYLILGVNNGSTAVFSGAVLTGATMGANTPPAGPDNAVSGENAGAAGSPADTAPTAGVPDAGPSAAAPDAAPTSTSTASPAATAPAKPQPAGAGGSPQPAAEGVKTIAAVDQSKLATGEDEPPDVVGTNKKLMAPLAFPPLRPYELPPQYLRLAGVIDPIIPAEDNAGWPLSSGMARFGQKSIHLTSINAVANSVEWIIYGGSGYSPQSPPAQLTLSFERIDGGVWIGLPNYTADRFDWQLLQQAGPHTISLENRGIVRQDGEMYFALGVCGGNYAEFSGGVLEEGTGVDLLGVYLSHGYWEADQMDAIFAELQALGVNFVVDYALRWPTDAAWQDEFNNYILAAQRHDIGIAYCLFPALAGSTPANADAQMNKALDEVFILRTNPAIKAWYVHDEVLPMLAGVGGTEQYSLSLKQMKDLYTKVHEADPGRPQINTWTQIPSRKQFNEMYSADNLPYGRDMWMDRDTAYEQTMQEMVRTTCDWVFVDDYPVGAPWVAPNAKPGNLVKATVGRVAALRVATQPMYFVFQAFSHAQYGRGNPEEAIFPTPAQMDEMLFAARLEGAQGALAYSWFDLTRTDLPGRDIPGRTKCLADVRALLKHMGEAGWPVPEPEKTADDK